LNETKKFFLVRRTCTRKSGNTDEQGSHSLESYRDLPAYVLLGDPGAGKTEAFKREAEESGSEPPIKARDFATYKPNREYQGKTLFIDALDEMRADGGDGWTAIAQVSKRLEELGCPRFRLSCREADWLGESDSAALQRISPNIVALHLDPLTDSDIIEILRHKSVPDPDDFVRKADEHRLGELLRNPQILNLLVKAIGGNEWPQSRKDIYEMACRQLVREESRAHRNAKREKHHSPDTLLDAAGYLCAIHLLSGIAGFALDEDASDKYHYHWNELTAHGLPLFPALKTNLFQKDGEEQRIPVHRSVAEFLGARYLAERVEKHGLPFGRVLALITGEDGGMVPDLRGLAAWLSVHCLSGRRALIERDPLGVVLYGDVRNFVVGDKQLVLEALKNEAQRYPWFRSTDWTSPPFGALGTTDMGPAFREILSSSSRTEAAQALLDCVLDALHYGESMPALTYQLETIVRDISYRSEIRVNAARALIDAISDDRSRPLRLAEDIHVGAVEDSDDELLGTLLHKLYPISISPVQIFDYLRPPRDHYLIGAYLTFWDHKLAALTTKEDLPILLDQMMQRHDVWRAASFFEHRINQMAGELLVKGLQAYGDSITDERLYDWLGVGLDEYEHTRFERERAEHIANWFADRPSRYKAVIERGASLCTGQEDIGYCMNRTSMRLHGTPPADLGIWYLRKAAIESQSDLAQYYFQQAVRMLIRDGGKECLTLPALEFIESWVNTYPIFQPWLERFITLPIGDRQPEHALEDRKWKIENQKNKNELLRFYRQHIAAIRNGSAHQRIFYDLAQAHEGSLLNEAHGDTPRERIENFLAGDNELIEAAYSGFRKVLDRPDLPSISEIVDLELEGKIPLICSACLIGMDELFQSDPVSAMLLPDEVLMRLLAFRLRYNVGNEPTWVSALVKIRPALAAEVLLAYALPMLRAKKEQVSGLYQLANDDNYAEVARNALPKLLEGFPLRASTNQLAFMLAPLLKGALHYLNRETLDSLVTRKLGLGSMDAAQRIYWLSCGLLLAPEVYEAKLFQYVGKSAARRGYVANFLYNGHGERRLPEWVSRPVTTLGRLIELLAPDCSPERFGGDGWMPPAMHTADMLRSFVNTLGSNPGELATRELERLLVLPKLAHWHNHLRHALHDQRIARRKATFRPLSVEVISRTLANLQPASAADLAALTLDHLRDIAKNIRNDSTNDYRQYWGYAEGDKKTNEPKSESDCRDALLSDMKARLGAQGIDAQREVNCADNKRTDIRVSFGGSNGFNVPIEIKQDRSPDLWRAIHEQLIPKYVRDPGADGHGIYLVFWFGGKGMRPPSDGEKLRSAAELEDRLRQTLTPEESHRIQICVIDCALPQ
jgi:hypothetical protein